MPLGLELGTRLAKDVRHEDMDISLGIQRKLISNIFLGINITLSPVDMGASALSPAQCSAINL